MKKDGQIYSDSKTQADILNGQFSPVEPDNRLPRLGPSPYPTIPDITITVNGVYKILARLIGSGNMTVDTINPAAPHTTATNITALAPMMTTLMNAALSCGTKRTYHRAISFWEDKFSCGSSFPCVCLCLGAFGAHLHSQRYALGQLL